PRGAGRTDAGVHALAQIAHIDLKAEWTPEIVMRALNHHLRPQPISVLSCERVDPGFDARFSALARHYLYRIITRPGPLAINRDRAWHIKHTLDLPAMQEAAQVLIGHHDFTTFRAAQCQSKSPEKTLDRFTVEREGYEIRIHASARSFLHHQVRSMTGSIKLVGEGKWTAATMRAALEARDRAACGMVAPSCGLYLLRVDY
ncbi:MAG: tRNA pseudouridine(38-40) synthase TruA, partial [Chitinophagales bacterium]|nr:tRNA pseudouridine(38-40) synthase TruA [Hyphomicrobiales bacterium]